MIPLEPMSPVHSTDLLNKLLDEKCKSFYRKDAKKGGDKYGSWLHACVPHPFLETKPNIPRETNWVLGGEW